MVKNRTRNTHPGWWVSQGHMGLPVGTARPRTMTGCLQGTVDATSGLEGKISPSFAAWKQLQSRDRKPGVYCPRSCRSCRHYHTCLGLKTPSLKNEGLGLAGSPGDRPWVLEPPCHTGHSVFVTLHLCIFRGIGLCFHEEALGIGPSLFPLTSQTL